MRSFKGLNNALLILSDQYKFTINIIIIVNKIKQSLLLLCAMQYSRHCRDSKRIQQFLLGELGPIHMEG